MDLTQEMADKYSTQPHRCPYCESEDISQYSEYDVLIIGRHVFITMLCRECRESWEDCYTLTGVNQFEFKEVEHGL